MAALENASVSHDIGDFTRFVAAEIAASAELKGPTRPPRSSRGNATA
jgi:hypothetical protein